MKTKQKFTPGPWYVALNGKIQSQKTKESICQMPFGSPREADQMPEADANSYLIAAAPEMYALLRGYYFTYPYDSYADAANKIIDKIEGQGGA